VIIEEDNKKYWIDATIDQIGAMSKAKLKDSLILLEDYIRDKDIRSLKTQIEGLALDDSSLLSWAYENHPDVDLKQQLIEQLNILEAVS
jgi:hypothetical protein